jgi:hypothetical protein
MNRYNITGPVSNTQSSITAGLEMTYLTGIPQERKAKAEAVKSLEAKQKSIDIQKRDVEKRKADLAANKKINYASNKDYESYKQAVEDLNARKKEYKDYFDRAVEKGFVEDYSKTKSDIDELKESAKSSKEILDKTLSDPSFKAKLDALGIPGLESAAKDASKTSEDITKKADEYVKAYSSRNKGVNPPEEESKDEFSEKAKSQLKKKAKYAAKKAEDKRKLEAEKAKYAAFEKEVLNK